MDFSERIAELSKKVRTHGESLVNEELTKNALVMPFIAALGYDVFNPSEVVPEFSAPIGEYKDARVDYAILVSGKPILLIECKSLGTPLESKQCNQLQLYFHGTEAPIAILTDGNRYRFYSDLEATNKMDSKPYMEFCLDDMDEALIPELRKLVKGKFDREACMSAASELKYTREFKRILAEQTNEPSDEFVRFFAWQVYDGKLTQNVKERFAPILKTAMNQFINDRINARLKSAMTETPKPAPNVGQVAEAPDESSGCDDPRIVTTEEEWQGYYLVKSILMGTVDSERVYIRDAVSYCNILLDDNNRKPLLRMHFNGKQLRIGLFDDGKKDEKHPIEKVDDILRYTERIRATATMYDASKQSQEEE